MPVPAILGEADEEQLRQPPSFFTVIGLLLVPLVLIFLNTGLDTLTTATGLAEDASWVQVLSAIGATPVALLISVLVATYVLGRRRGTEKSVLEKTLDSALGPVSSVILITGAGGMFGGVLQASGIGDALANTLEGIGLPVIVAGFLISTILRIAQGSATVALITAAGLVQPAVAAGGYSGVELATIVLALSAGSVMASHVNDSGFWLVGRFLDMDVPTTLKTWTVIETLIGLMGFGISALLFLIV